MVRCWLVKTSEKLLNFAVSPCAAVSVTALGFVGLFPFKYRVPFMDPGPEFQEPETPLIVNENWEPSHDRWQKWYCAFGNQPGLCGLHASPS